MENYLKNYDSFEKKIVYNFPLGSGGIGDLTKYFMYILNICIKHDIKIFYLINDIPIEKYLKLKYSKMYITQKDIANNTSNINNTNEIPNINPNIFYVVTPQIFYGIFSYDNLYPFQEIFGFSNEVIINSNNLCFDVNNYICLHLRLGDKYLETDSEFVLCKEDAREYNEEQIFKFIENNADKNILFFCDNRNFKLKIKNRYNKVIITDYEIGHTSLLNTTDIQVLNTIFTMKIMVTVILMIQ
jgi:hypothetical protein